MRQRVIESTSNCRLESQRFDYFCVGFADVESRTFRTVLCRSNSSCSIRSKVALGGVALSLLQLQHAQPKRGLGLRRFECDRLLKDLQLRYDFTLIFADRLPGSGRNHHDQVSNAASS